MVHILRPGIASLLLMSAFSAQAATVIQVNDAYMNQHYAMKKGALVSENSHYQLKPEKIKLSNGLIKNKYTLFYKGVPVFNALISSSEKQGKQVQWFGKMITDIEDDVIDVEPKINKETLLNTLITKMALSSNDVISNRQASLYIRLDDKNKAELIYLVSFNIEGKNAKRPYFIVNAQTGVIIKSWDGLSRVNAEGPGGNEKTGKYYYTRDYGALEVTDDCTMSNDRVEVYNMQNKYSGGTLYRFVCPVNYYKQVNGAYSPINDALYFGTKVIEMYNKWFNVEPLKSKFKIRVHYGVNEAQATWDGQQMTFGDGNADFYPLTSIDVMGHEVSHAVTEKYSGLVYVYQSGGINEAFSDIAGETAKFYVNQEYGKTNDWLSGWSVIKKADVAMRYFANPTLDGVSIDNAVNYNDSLNVHSTSGVFNKAFYLLATKPNWGVRKAFLLFLTANQVYWDREATFNSAACGVAKAALDYGYGTKAIIASFKQVGVDANCPK